MLIDGDLPPNYKVIDETLLYPRIPSGLTEGQNSLVRYTHSSLKEPILKIADYIYDYRGNYISPGLYELALSDDKEFLLLIESHNLVAVIPVFKLAQNQAEVERQKEKIRNQGRKIKPRKVRYEEKVKAILRKKYAEDAITPPEEDYTYMRAEIEYITEGGYYLITYENGMYRAWGAIKVRNEFGGKSPIQMRKRAEE